jgi:predicted GH43/DUF377 family glycosyl hydrolase
MKYCISCIVLVLLLGCSISAQKIKESLPANPDLVLTMVSEEIGPIIGPDQKDVIDSKNRSGFETGQVVKIGETYHMFVNEMFERAHRDMRIAYWTSQDAVDWKRQGTIVNSIPERSPSNSRSEVWVTGVVFNQGENAWNIFYVAYRAGDKDKGEIEGNDYAGRIWRAKSVITGRDGIAGPYVDMGIVLQPDENSQDWEGQQAIASFNPYHVGDKWYSTYDGHTHIPRGGWPTGLATADKLNGPWTRMPETINPLEIVDEFMENGVTTKMKNGNYLMVFDSFGNQQIGYSTSEDGVNWSKEKRITVQSEKHKWALDGDHYTRTPLCAIEEVDGTFTVVYTAVVKNGDKSFYAVGKCTLAWK